jgi:two-component system cell cycle response regulator DivK
VSDSPDDRLGMRGSVASWLLRAALEARGGDSARVVLVVDDEAPTRTVFAAFLRRRGFEVLEAEHGQNALAVARQAEPDAIVLDIQMPVLDGVTTAELLKLDASTAHIPLIAVTGHPFEGGEAEARRYGFSAYLPKPLPPEELAEAISSLFGMTA